MNITDGSYEEGVTEEETTTTTTTAATTTTVIKFRRGKDDVRGTGFLPKAASAGILKRPLSTEQQLLQQQQPGVLRQATFERAIVGRGGGRGNIVLSGSQR